VIKETRHLNLFLSTTLPSFLPHPSCISQQGKFFLFSNNLDCFKKKTLGGYQKKFFQGWLVQIGSYFYSCRAEGVQGKKDFNTCTK